MKRNIDHIGDDVVYGNREGREIGSRNGADAEEGDGFVAYFASGIKHGECVRGDVCGDSNAAGLGCRNRYDTASLHRHLCLEIGNRLRKQVLRCSLNSYSYFGKFFWEELTYPIGLRTL